jgi:hypothetical protein
MKRKCYSKTKKFAFNVLEVCLQIDMGRKIFRDYHNEANAQQAWIFSQYMKTSTKAESYANNLLAWLTTSKYDTNWRGSSQA